MSVSDAATLLTLPDERPESSPMDACKALRDRLIEEGDLPASRHSVTLLKCNGGLGIRTDSGDVSCLIYPLNATEGLVGATFLSFRCHDAYALKQSPLRRFCGCGFL